MLRTRDNRLGAGHSRPVFVDRTGRRRRVAVLAGAAMAAGFIAWLGLLLAGLFTEGPLPVPGWPEGGSRVHQEQAGAEQPVPSPTPVRAPREAPTAAPPTAPAASVVSAPRSPDAVSTDGPGQSDERRRTPSAGRPSKSPGKPS